MYMCIMCMYVYMCIYIYIYIYVNIYRERDTHSIHMRSRSTA